MNMSDGYTKFGFAQAKPSLLFLTSAKSYNENVKFLGIYRKEKNFFSPANFKIVIKGPSMDLGLHLNDHSLY